MKMLAALLLAFTLSPLAQLRELMRSVFFAPQTWYVNSTTGGTRYSADNTKGQCNGKANTPYPGTGTNRSCPFNDPRLLWNDPYHYQSAAWVMAGGDTVIFETGGQISGSLDASAVGKFCFGSGVSCAPPDLPSGSSGSPTRLLGANYASCSVSKTFQDASYPTLAGDVAKQALLTAYTSSGEKAQFALSVATSHYVEIKCLDFDGKGSRAGNGLFSGNKEIPGSGDILIEDTTFHGFADSGWRGNIGGTFTLNRVGFLFNAQSGVDNDAGNNQPSKGAIVGNYVSVFGNGCSEESPVVHAAFPATNCKDQNNGGSGDGWGTSVTANMDFSCDHCLFGYNTQDGPDFGHVVNSHITISNTQMYGNMGGNLKGGPGAVTTFTNDVINANCMRMHDPIGGNSTFNAGLTYWCRASDQNSMAALTNATALEGQMQATGTTVRGSGTHFLKQLTVGSLILPGGEELSKSARKVTAIASDTSLTVASPFAHNIDSNEPIILIPAGGAKSSTVLTVLSSSFVGYGGTLWDVPCQTGLPQAQVDNALCAGVTFVYKGNISMGYSIAAYNQGQSPGVFYNISPTAEDYNIFYGFRGPYGAGPHDRATSPQFVGQPAKPLTGQNKMDSFNFKLAAGSPAKGAGPAGGGVTSDFLGSARKGQTSIGAIEADASAP